MIPIIDIFAGPGGLGEGFSSFVDENGDAPFKIRLSIEKEFHAHQTLLLRAFFRQFKRGKAPKEYYEVLRAEREVDSLYERYPKEATQAKKEAGVPGKICTRANDRDWDKGVGNGERKEA
jgi:DNA (cytosine-5)-methyltransferase 1